MKQATRRIAQWIYAMILEIPALMAMFVLWLIPTQARRRKSGRPILLVHGYMNHGSVWRICKNRLESAGLGPIYTVNLGHPFRSIIDYAAKIKEKAADIAKETERRDLVLIGHSMGGLVSSWYALELAPPSTVTDVITIGSPFFGTSAAHLGLGPNAKEMQPNSPFLKKLRAAIARNKGIRFFHMATKQDQIIIPPSSAIIPENEHILFERIGHISLLYSKQVSDQMIRWLL